MVVMIVDTTIMDVEGITMVEGTMADEEVTTMVEVTTADEEVTTTVEAVEGITTVVVMEETIAGMVAAVVDVTTMEVAGAAALLQRQLLTNKPKLTTDLGILSHHQLVTYVSFKTIYVQSKH
nr:hypothetical protein [Salmonella sp. S152_61454]